MARFFRKTGAPTIDPSVWTGKSNAAKLLQTEFFGLDSVGAINYWNGAEWLVKPLLYWTGSAWVQKPVRYWDDYFWLLSNYGYGPNYFSSSSNIYNWSANNAVNCTLTSEVTTPASPFGGLPLKMTVTGNDPYTNTFNNSLFNITAANNSETWAVKVYVKGSVDTTGQIYMYGADSTGAILGQAGSFSIRNISIKTNWTEVTANITFPAVPTISQVNFLQIRLDGPDTGGTGVIIHWDGLRVYKII